MEERIESLEKRVAELEEERIESLEKRVAELEEELKAQPEKICDYITQKLVESFAASDTHRA